MEPRKYGYIPDPPSDKDRSYADRAHAVNVSDLPSSTNNIQFAPPVVNQGQLGSCTANAIGAALRHDQIKQGIDPNFMPSRLFIYYNERLLEGTVGEDTGACIRTGIKVVAHAGAPPEHFWPYVEDMFKHCPNFAAYREAHKHQAVEYYRVDNTNLNDIRVCLAGGHGIVFGFQVPEHFESAEVQTSGVLHMPAQGEKFMGGHAVYMLDYDNTAIFPTWDEPGGVLVQNSWGEEWGIKGRFWMPYKFLVSGLINDCWTIRKVEA